MPKMTAKWKAALSTARKVWKLSASEVQRFEMQELLYERLVEAGYLWDSTQQEWIELKAEPADPPGETIRIRVWADAEVVQEAADDMLASLKRRGFRMVEMSKPYPCRPPKQLESRIYLSLLPPDKKGKA